MAKKKTAASRKKSKTVKSVITPGEELGGKDIERLPKQIYLPGMAMPEVPEGDEDGRWELEPDMSAYHLLRGWQTEWPCLSFDVLRDSLGEERTAYPMSAMFVAGSQAAREQGESELMVMRLANLHKNGRPSKEKEGSDSEESEDEEDEDDEEEDEKRQPQFVMASVAHPGCVNRVRTHRPSGLTATWSDRGAVHIWALQDAMRLVSDAPLTGGDKTHRLQLSPLHSQEVGCEGYALDWSRGTGMSLLAGDCNARIGLFEVSANGAVSIGAPFTGHEGSVEDIQWSPTEQTVFASCSTDGTVRLWDTRVARTAAALTHRVSQVDVNVLSWNPVVGSGHLLATGDDAGRMCTWDLRALSTALYTSDWHTDAITSVEWNPVDASVLAVSGADDQTTLWDFAIASTEEPQEIEGRVVPAQLLFVHQGQQLVKEVHWHPQLAGVLVSTAASGFHLFKTISV